MPNYRAVARESHQHKVWHRARSAGFAAEQILAPITNAELSNAARALPLAFAAADEGIGLVALMGLQPNKNVLVAPDGRWIGLYMPALLRAHPFRLANTPDSDRLTLVVDEDSGLVKDSAVGDGGIAFFGADGQVSPETQKVVDFLTAFQSSRVAMMRSVKAIEDAGILEDWPIQFQHEGKPTTATGLKRVKEEALNALDAETLHGLRTGGGLAMAYAQLISMGNLSVLTTFLAAREKAKNEQMRIPEKSFLPEDDGSLKIDWNALLSNK